MYRPRKHSTLLLVMLEKYFEAFEMQNFWPLGSLIHYTTFLRSILFFFVGLLNCLKLRLSYLNTYMEYEDIYWGIGYTGWKCANLWKKFASEVQLIIMEIFEIFRQNLLAAIKSNWSNQLFPEHLFRNTADSSHDTRISDTHRSVIARRLPDVSLISCHSVRETENNTTKSLSASIWYRWRDIAW